MFKLDSIVFAKKIEVLGSIGVLDILNNKVTIVAEDSELHVVDFNDVIELERIGNFGEYEVYEGDVFELIYLGDDIVMYELVKADGNKLRFNKLDKNLEVTNKDLATFDLEALEGYKGVLKLVGNINELRLELQKALEVLNFNIRIVKHQENGEFTYYYVGNNKEDGTVDLIKVIYMGHYLLEEEDYSRITLSRDEYLEAILDGTYKNVSASELNNYVTGMLYGKKAEVTSKASVSMENVEVEEDEVCDGECVICDCFNTHEQDDDVTESQPDNICNKCGQDDSNCECELWKR